MRRSFSAILFIITLFSYSSVKAQEYHCDDFEDSTNSDIQIDSNSIWEIGVSNKIILNGSLNGVNSIATNLDSNYRNNDSSSFYFVVPPIYLTRTAQITFNHRHEIDSNDFGTISVSFDGGQTWNVLDTVTGNRLNWKRVELDNTEFIGGLQDSIQVRFSFITDSTGTAEGWVIDILCFLEPYVGGFSSTSQNDVFKIYPNPNEGERLFIDKSLQEGQIIITNSFNQIIEIFRANASVFEFQRKLNPGVYFITWINETTKITKKLIIQ